MLSDLRKSVPEACLSDLLLDELRADDLDANRKAQAEQHLRSCARCTARQQVLLAAALEFTERYPEAPVVTVPRATRSIGRIYAGLTAALALAACVVLFVRAERVARDSQAALERSKGGARLGFYVKRDGHVFQGADGQRVHAGDELRFVVTNAAQHQIAILSRDGRGVTSVYYPSQRLSRALGSAHETALDTAVQLDATPGAEALFGIFCDSEFELEPLRSTLEKTGHLPAMKGCTVDELGVIKDAP
jgi:plastocyanin